MSLQARLDAFKADFEAGEPPYRKEKEVHGRQSLVSDGGASKFSVNCAARTSSVSPRLWDIARRIGLLPMNMGSASVRNSSRCLPIGRLI